MTLEAADPTDNSYFTCERDVQVGEVGECLLAEKSSHPLRTDRASAARDDNHPPKAVDRIFLGSDGRGRGLEDFGGNKGLIRRTGNLSVGCYGTVRRMIRRISVGCD